MTDQITPRLSVTAYEESSPAATVLVPIGDVDLASAEHLRGLLLPAIERGTTVLDMTGVEFCDSSGLRVLMEADRKARAHGTSFRLAGPTAPVERLLGLTRAHEVLSVYPDLESALRA